MAAVEAADPDPLKTMLRVAQVNHNRLHPCPNHGAKSQLHQPTWILAHAFAKGGKGRSATEPLNDRDKEPGGKGDKTRLRPFGGQDPRAALRA